VFGRITYPEGQTPSKEYDWFVRNLRDARLVGKALSFFDGEHARDHVQAAGEVSDSRSPAGIH
jgi:hypothetical protein